MEKYKTQSEEVHEVNGKLAPLFKVLSKPDALKILSRVGQEIRNSTYTMEELNLTPKKYYTRLRELMNEGLVRKKDDVYRQTALGRIMYNRFLPAMGKAVDAKGELELIVSLEGTELENEVRKRIEEELGIPIFTDSTNVKLLGDYEALAIEVIDLYDSAEESVLLASNYVDVRVIEAFLRAVDRGVTNRAMMGKNRQSSKIQSLRMMLSVTFARTIINFASNTEELKNTVRFVDLPYTFCVVDGRRSIIEFSDTINDSFIAALSVDDRDIGEKFTKFYETLWNAGESNSAIEGLNYLKSS